MQLCHSFMSPESAKFVMSCTTLPAITLNNNATNLFGTTFVFYLIADGCGNPRDAA